MKFIVSMAMCVILADMTSSAETKCPIVPEGSPLYPYGPCEGDDLLHKNDDKSDWIDLKANVSYFWKVYPKMFINTNGAVSFTDDLFMGNPQQFRGTTTIVAVYWADVDTRFAGGSVYVGQDTSGERLIRAKKDMDAILPGHAHFEPSMVAVVTWSEVTFFGASKVGREKRNTFQLVLIADDIHTYALFLYQDLVWTTGTTSGGDMNSGLDGSAAVVGYDVGNKHNWFTVPESFHRDIMSVATTSNIGGEQENGRWWFNLNPDCAPQGTYDPLTGEFVGGGIGVIKPVMKCLQKRTCCHVRGSTYTATPGCAGFRQSVGYVMGGPAQNCAPGLKFNTNPNKCICDWPWNVKCKA